MTIPLGIMSPFAGRALKHVAPEVLLGVGMLVLAGSAGLFLLVTDSSSVLVLLAALAVSGVGQAVVFNVSNIEAVGSVPVARSGMAAGVVSAVRQTGSLVGLAATERSVRGRECWITPHAATRLRATRPSSSTASTPRWWRCSSSACSAHSPRPSPTDSAPRGRGSGDDAGRCCGQRADEGGPGTSLTGTLSWSRASSSGVSL